MNAYTTVTIPLDEDQARLLRDYFDLAKENARHLTPALFIEEHLADCLMGGAARAIEDERARLDLATTGGG